ncbi:MAG: LPD38 domain-containing protein, partial [Candidatus Neomarinimicrobiota bacterium]
QKLYNLVRENPGAEWWIEESKKEPTFDQGGNITYYPSIKEPANGVHVKIDGKRYTIMVDNHDKTMMRMIKSIKEANVGMGPIIEMLGKVSRLLAALNTSFSPEFMITNFGRDIQTAGINLEDSVAKGAQAAIGKNVLSAVRGIYRTERGKESEWTEIYRDFENNGGKIGWMQSYETIEDLASQLESEMKTYGEGHTLRKNLVALKELVQSGNTAIENGVRLSTYKYLVDHGVSKQKAALTASNLTVDFTRRGAAGQNLNALYMFANAGIQGNVRMIKAAVRSAKVRKLLGGIIGTGYALHFLALMSGGDDDDGIPFIDKVDDSEKERSMIIMLKDGKKVKIPMPYGYNIFFNLGDELAEMTHHLLVGKEYSPLQGMARLGSVFMNSFNPLSSATLLQTIMPTVGDPVAMVAENKTWYGGDLMPEKNPFGIAKPDSERYWKSASFASREIASRLNALTGGDKVKPGKIDVSPETLDLMVDTYTGSAGRFVKNTLMLPFKALEGDLSSRNVPFIRTVFGTQFEGTDANIYRRNADRVLTLKAQVKAAEGERRRQLMQSKEYRLVKITDAYEKRLKKLYSHLRLLESKGIKDERVDKIKEAIRKRQKRYNQQFNMVISQ